MERKMIFFDIDGTLVPEYTNTIPESVQTAIKQAMENGHLAFINSGRTLVNIHPNIKKLGFSGYCCGCGTEIYLGEEPLYFFQLDQESCYEIASYFLEHSLTALFEGTDSLHSCGSVEDHRNMAEFGKTLGVPLHPIHSKEDIEKISFTKMVYWKPSHMPESEVQEFLSKWFSIIDRGNGMREAVPANHSKATAIQYLCDHFQIPLENCYAIGDSTNDLPMLEYVPHAIAMGVSMKEILPYVEYQTDTVENDGVVKALKHYHII